MDLGNINFKTQMAFAGSSFGSSNRTIDTLMQPTLKTKLLQCSYTLEVILDFTGFCAADPTLCLPLVLFTPAIAPDPQAMMEPQNWKPQQQLPEFNFTIPANDPQSYVYTSHMQSQGIQMAPQPLPLPVAFPMSNFEQPQMAPQNMPVAAPDVDLEKKAAHEAYKEPLLIKE